METGKHQAGLTNLVLAKDHLHAGEEGKSNLKLYLATLGRLRGLLPIAQYRGTCLRSAGGHRGEGHERKCYD